MDKIFETERVYARNWSPDDAWEAFESYMSDPEVGPRAGWLPHRSPEESREYLNDVVRPGVEMCLVYKPTGKIIGAIGLHPDKLRNAERVNSREIGYVLAKPYWGMGLMPEAVRGVLDYAFGTLGLDMVMVRHAKDNEGSRRVCEKCGFVREGILRQADYFYPEEKVEDQWLYSMTRVEWEKGRSHKETPPAWKFVQNRACPYFPCHKGVDEARFSCQFCYCPLYLKKDCGGAFVILPNGIKDCSNCLLPHLNYDHIMDRLIADSIPQ